MNQENERLMEEYERLASDVSRVQSLYQTLLHSERPKLYGILAALSAIESRTEILLFHINEVIKLVGGRFLEYRRASCGILAITSRLQPMMLKIKCELFYSHLI